MLSKKGSSYAATAMSRMGIMTVVPPASCSNTARIRIGASTINSKAAMRVADAANEWSPMTSFVNTSRWGTWEPTKFDYTRPAPIIQDAQCTTRLEVWAESGTTQCWAAKKPRSWVLIRLLNSTLRTQYRRFAISEWSCRDGRTRLTQPNHEATREDACLPMTQDVANALLIPNFPETPNKGTVGVPVMAKGICRIPTTPMPPLSDLGAHSSIAHAPGTHIPDLAGDAGGGHSGKPTASDTSTVILDVLHHRVLWRVTTVRSGTWAGHAACQSA